MRATAGLACVVLAATLSACGDDDGSADAGRGDVDADLRVHCGATGSSGPGGRCECGSECGDGLICGSEETAHLPGGFCIQTCDVDVSTSCPDGFACVAAVKTAFCAPNCKTTLDCDPGRICVTHVGASGVCAAYCDEDSECVSGHCNVLSGLCSDGTPAPGLGLDERCTRHEECQSGKCIEGRCGTVCAVSDPHCPPGSACISVIGTDVGQCHFECDPGGAPCALEGMACTESPASPDVHVCTPSDGCFGRGGANTDGRPCGCASDCDSGSTCVPEITFPIPHGGCLRDCAASPSVCGAGSRCSLIRGTGRYGCLALCTTTAECGVGRMCSSSGYCDFACQFDDDCVNRRCDRYTGLCAPSDATRLPNGSLCTASSQCRSGLCYTAATGGEQFCQSFCAVSAQVCPDSGVCVPFDSTHDWGLCMRPCTLDTECPSGQHCADASVPGMSIMACRY